MKPMITRKAAIQAMAGVLATAFGGLKNAYGQSGMSMPGLSMSFGDPVPPPPPPNCPTSSDAFTFTAGDCRREDGSIRPGRAIFTGNQYIPGTASTTMDLDAFKSFTFKHGGETVTITRDEMWEALKGA